MSLKLQESQRRWLKIYDKQAIIEASKLENKESVHEARLKPQHGWFETSFFENIVNSGGEGLKRSHQLLKV